jgi:orotidine-5'-phosphate decarboxylase
MKKNVTFVQKLRQIQQKNNSLLCIGLDTDLLNVPDHLKKRANPQLEFNKQIIEATGDLVCAYKLNISFYESIGKRGWETVRNTLDCIPHGIVTIGDGKRGDISNSAERSAHLFCDDWAFDGTTVNPYMGRDAIDPFIKRADQCAFVLALTSNPTAKDFQYLKVNGKPLYEIVVGKIKTWNTLNNLGLVVGATHPDELKRIRNMVPDMPILIPGIGAQQGDLEMTVKNGCDNNGELAIINIGRAICNLSSGKDFARKTREAALNYRNAINRYREKYFERK